MNAMLRGLEGDIVLGDSLAVDGVTLPRADLVLTNPPFGSKRGAGRPMRRDLPFPTANKQLAFLQLIYQSLAPGGRAGVVLPDNVLTEDGVAARVRDDLMQKCNLHTILRLPTGIFYAQGVKTNVLFFTRGRTDGGNTRDVWIYDLRTSMPSFGKRTPLTRENFREFERLYGDAPDRSGSREDQGEEGRFRRFTQADIHARGGVFDFKWMKDTANGWDTDGDVADVVALLKEKVQLALDDLDVLVATIEGEEGAE
jgi:type I restriction enzyme M protein